MNDEDRIATEQFAISGEPETAFIFQRHKYHQQTDAPKCSQMFIDPLEPVTKEVSR